MLFRSHLDIADTGGIPIQVVNFPAFVERNIYGKEEKTIWPVNPVFLQMFTSTGPVTALKVGDSVVTLHANKRRQSK